MNHIHWGQWLHDLHALDHGLLENRSVYFPIYHNVSHCQCNRYTELVLTNIQWGSLSNLLTNSTPVFWSVYISPSLVGGISSTSMEKLFWLNNFIQTTRNSSSGDGTFFEITDSFYFKTWQFTKRGYRGSAHFT